MNEPAPTYATQNGHRQAMPFTYDDYLDDLEIERSAIMMRLRRIDKRLMAGGRLKETHVPGQYQDRVR